MELISDCTGIPLARSSRQSVVAVLQLKGGEILVKPILENFWRAPEGTKYAFRPLRGRAGF
jgi:hypothetical protein